MVCNFQAEEVYQDVPFAHDGKLDLFWTTNVEKHAGKLNEGKIT